MANVRLRIEISLEHSKHTYTESFQIHNIVVSYSCFLHFLFKANASCSQIFSFEVHEYTENLPDNDKIHSHKPHISWVFCLHFFAPNYQFASEFSIRFYNRFALIWSLVPMNSFHTASHSSHMRRHVVQSFNTSFNMNVTAKLWFHNVWIWGRIQCSFAISTFSCLQCSHWFRVFFFITFFR